MCGIIGIHFKNPRDLGVGQDNLERFVDELLLGIEPRGRDATGLLTVDAKGKTNLVKADVDASTFIKWRDTCPKRVRTILGHTRFATQGTPMNLDNNHPVQSGSCYAIHNGHISNDTELFTEFSLARAAEVDSEIIPALLNLVGLDKARDALELLDGNYAVAAVDPERFPNTTILAKGWSSPVELYENKYAVVWASTQSALKDAVSHVFNFDLPDRNIESLGLGELLVMEGNTVERLKFKPLAKYRPTTLARGYGNGYSSYSSQAWREIDDDDDEIAALAPSTYTEVSDFMSEECASCGCERLYHGSGSNFSGACNFIVSNTNFRCRCIGFKLAPSYRGEGSGRLDMEACDGCHRDFYVGDLVKVGQKYLCPSLCAKDPAVSETVEVVKSLPAADLRKRAEDVLSRQYARLDDSGGDIDDAWAVREEAINEHVCVMAATKTGQEPAYINWLVNEMEKDLAELDETGYLGGARAIAGKAFFDAWGKLCDEIEEIEAVKFSVAEVGDACNTESDECYCLTNGGELCGECMADEEVCGVVVGVEEELVG